MTLDPKSGIAYRIPELPGVVIDWIRSQLNDTAKKTLITQNLNILGNQGSFFMRYITQYDEDDATVFEFLLVHLFSYIETNIVRFHHSFKFSFFFS